jgi:hypothetical protein
MGFTFVMPGTAELKESELVLFLEKKQERLQSSEHEQ